MHDYSDGYNGVTTEAHKVNDANRQAEEVARAARLQADWAIATGLRNLVVAAFNYSDPCAAITARRRDAFVTGRFLGHFGPQEGSYGRLVALLRTYDYLNSVPAVAFGNPPTERAEP